jgi:hypothetical protein
MPEHEGFPEMDRHAQSQDPCSNTMVPASFPELDSTYTHSFPSFLYEAMTSGSI